MNLLETGGVGENPERWGSSYDHVAPLYPELS